MSRRWVCFDIGEVLVDETRVWSTWADVIGVPRFTLMALIGGAIATGGSHLDAFGRLGVRWQDFSDEVQERFGGIQAVDLYPDALPALAALSVAGYGVAVTGNQPARREPELRALGFEPDVMVMSDTLGVQKPDPAFFAAVTRLLAAFAADIAYVGDRIDNDVTPAAAAGMRPVWLRRGPWGWSTDDAPAAAVVVGSLDELVQRVPEVWSD